MSDEHYASLARLYDDIMSYVPYENWLCLIHQVCKRYGLNPRAKILELGGGTGTLGTVLCHEGFEYQGTDLSPWMSRAAYQKGLDFVCADARHIPFNDTYDLVIFLFDGINYLSNITDFTQIFREAHRVLRPGGCFLFDVTTEYNSLENFNEYLEAESFEHGAYIRNSFYDAQKREQINAFEMFLADSEQPSQYIRVHETHCQHVYSPEEITAAVPTDLFELCGVWDAFGMSPWKADSERIHFLLRKPAE